MREETVSGTDGGVEDCVGVFAENFDFVRRVLRRQGVGEAGGDDLWKEVFIAMGRGWSGYGRERPVRPWLWGIAFRVARNYLRRRWREVPDAEIDVEDEAEPGEARLAAAQARALVLRALARLPEKYRTPLVLHELDEIPANDVATML